MSLLLFLNKFCLSRGEIGAIIPSSNFLAKKMVNKIDIENSKVIVEVGAGTGIMTNHIFKYVEPNLENKKIFIIEKDKDFYNILIKKFPNYRNMIFNIDVLDIENLLNDNNIKKVDLFISSLPFKSLPKNLLDKLIIDIFPKIFTKNTIFIQFSYFANFSKELDKYFNNIQITKCCLNFPFANIFRCINFIKYEN